MISGASRYSGVGEEAPLGAGGRFVTGAVNKALGTSPTGSHPKSDSALMNTFYGLGPTAQTVVIVMGGLFVIRVIRSVL
jgi:hypothetical protein